MPWKLKLVVLGLFTLWCVILWYISFHMDVKKDDKNSYLLTGLKSVRKMSRFSSRKIKPVQVFLASDENSVGGMIAAINSILSNTMTPVHFYLVTNELQVRHLTSWIERTKLSKMSYNLTAFPYSWLKGKFVNLGNGQFPNKMDYARFYIPDLFPNLNGILIHIDNDVIVQGDIAELAATSIPTENYGAFSLDCQSVSKRLNPIQNTYSSYINFNNHRIKKLKMNPTTCSFNTGVFVVNVTTWRKANLTAQLLNWMALNNKEKIYPNHFGSQPAIMIVFYNKISPIDPMWHVRHLGISGASHYSKLFLRQAKLLHWDGHYKPWSGHSANLDIWDKYYIDDPTGHFRPKRIKNSL